MVQRLQHQLRIYERAMAIIDDEEIVDENDPEKSDDSSNDNKGYLGREHHKDRPREHARGDNREYGREGWYERHDRLVEYGRKGW